MTIHVDPLFPTTPTSRWPYTQACHMTTDGNIEELHVFAERLGLRRSFFQGRHVNPVMHHYDLTPNKRALAVKLGAREITWEERAAIIHAATDVLWAKKTHSVAGSEVQA